MHQAFSARAALAAILISIPVRSAEFAVLDFWGAGGFVHESRVSANKYLDSLSQAMGFELVKSQDPAVFTKANLAKYDVVVLNHVSKLGLVLNADQRAVALEFFRTKGTVAWHGAGDIQGSWPEYLAFLGCQFTAHGANTQTATMKRDPGAAAHPVTRGLEAATFDEEWYSYSRNPRGTAGVKILYTLDESTCKGCGPSMGSDHPIVWTVESPAGGRFFHSGVGHKDDVFLKYAFMKTMFAQAMGWAAEAGTATQALERPMRPGRVAVTGGWFPDGRAETEPARGAVLIRR